MKRVLFAAALFALALSGCDTMRGWFGMGTNEKPVVTVTNGRIDVSPEPLEFRGRGEVVITWKLDDSAAGFQFTSDGIRIEDRKGEFVDFRVTPNGKQFQVKNKNTVAGTYKYTIHLRGPNGPVVLDPTIINME